MADDKLRHQADMLQVAAGVVEKELAAIKQAPADRETLRTLEQALLGVLTESHRMVNDGARAASSRRVAPQGRQDEVRELATSVAERQANQVAVIDAIGRVLHHDLVNAATPKLDKAEVADARQRLNAILDRTPARERVGMLRELAGRGDALGAAAAGEPGMDYLATLTRDPREREDALAGIRAAAVRSALNSEDPARQKAAEALTWLEGSLGRARDAAQLSTHHAASLAEQLTERAGRSEDAGEVGRWRGLYQQERARNEQREAQAAPTDGAGGPA